MSSRASCPRVGGRRGLPAIGSLLLALGCAAESGDTALDLELNPDPNVNTPEQLVAALETIVLVLDSPDGLYPPGSERVVGDVQIKNVDTDAAPEVVVLVPVPPGRLPWIRVSRGGLPDEPLTIRVTGLAAGGSTRAIASGSVEGILFEEGEIVPVSIPFDLGPEVRAPRVEEVLPPDEAEAAGCVVGEVTIVFAEPMDETTVTADGAIAIERNGDPVSIGPVRLSGSGYIATVTPSGLSGAPLRYRVTVATSVRGLDGNALDQSAAQEGDQAYDAEFQLGCP